MKVGDVCRCLSDFSGISSEELTLYKNDIVQVHEVVDKHWVRGEGGGSVGLVPSSVLVGVELPPHPSHLPLFVASAEFLPSQPGDLGLARGDFVVGLNPINDSWWTGETWGKQGMFPLNFVWSLNKDIIEVEDTSEQQVKLLARVRSSIRAQLPEELNLYAGDLVTITHIVDKDWYRGESNGATGIFPKSFVDIVDESSVPSPPVIPQENNFMVVSDTASSCHGGGSLSDTMPASSPPSSACVPPPLTHTVPSSAPPPSHPKGPHDTADALQTPSVTPQSTTGRTDPSMVLSKISTAWKTIDADNEDIFDDDYFRQNMPGMYSSKGGGNAPPAYTGEITTSTLSTASGASVSLACTESRYENIPVCVPEQEANLPVPSSDYTEEETRPDQYRYENIPVEEPHDLGKDNGVLSEGPEHSALLGQQNGISKMDSLSLKVEEYLSSSLLGESSASTSAPAWTYRAPSYTEDNTGIEPYGRAVFSFSAQYPNELTFKKGEIVHLLQHVDSHWTLGRVGESEGIFPTSYVDIIVDCPHSEEQHFLARPEAGPSASHLTQAMAQYDFEAEHAGDISMKKGDLLTVIKEVDTNWLIVENTCGSKGLCPKNYLVFLKKSESPEVKELHSQATDSISDSTSDSGGEQRSRVSHQDSAHQRSRSSSPFSASWKRRSYNKDDFGMIKKQDVEQVLARNIASLDAASKTSVSRPEKSGNSVFMEREVSSGEHKQEDTQQHPERPKPTVLPRQSKMMPSRTSSVPKLSDKPTTNHQTIIQGTSRTTASPVPTTTPTAITTPTTPTTALTPITVTTTPTPTTTTTTSTAITTPATPPTTLTPITVTTTPTPTTTTTTTSTSITTPTTTPTPTSRTGPFTFTRPAPLPLIPPRTKLYTTTNSSEPNSPAPVLKPPPSPSQVLSQPQPVPQSPSQSQLSNQSLPQPSSQSQPQPSSQSQPQPPSQSQSSNQSLPHTSDQAQPSNQPLPQPSSQLQPSSQPLPQPSNQPIYSQVRKSPRRRSQARVVEAGSAAGTQQPDSCNGGGANFPDDVSQVSVANEATYSSDVSLRTTSAGLVPQRPAPPPPPKLPDTVDQDEHYYSLAPQETEATKCQAVEVERENENQYVNEERVDEEEKEEAKAAAPTPGEGCGMRRVVIQEITTTEHEYIQDLEALLQVVQMAPSRPGGTQGVHLPTLLGNITQVVDVAKRFAGLLDQSAYGEEEEVCVGRVFLACADDLCQTYKVYCANHNITVEPLMRKYEQEEGSAAFLHWVLEELQQRKIQLLDMRSVLIKPLQRVLKYPLFLDRLVRDTPPHHPDHQDLLEAKTAMANAAKEINDYTTRIDLVYKYRVETDQSLQSKMQRVSLHSVAKKSARLSTLVSEMLGIMVQTKDLEFDEEVAKFRAMQRWTAAIVQNLEALLQGVKARHRGELGVAKGLLETLLKAGPEVEAVHRVAMDSAGRLFESFDNFVRQRVLLPTKELMRLCEVPDRLILKRNDKLLDYDNAQYKLDRNRDPTRTRILEEELSQAQGTYSALNTQLMMDLPVLIKTGVEVLSLATRSLISARMYLQGHVARLYLNLAQGLGLALVGEEDMLTQFRVKYLQQVGEFRQLSFIPAESHHQWSLPRAKSRSRKSLDATTAKKEHTEAAKTKVLGQYPRELVYVVREVHTPGEVMELTLYPGDHVALLKNKDPLGRTDRWFVDDGDNKGFVRASFLKPLLERDGGVAAAVPLPASGGVAPAPQPPQPHPTIPRPSTVPRPAPAPPEQAAPPRYEDIFPADPTTTTLPHSGSGYPRAPPPRYSSIGTPASVPQPPLPTKPDPRPAGELHGGAGDYYSPPLDRQLSGDYNSPVSEENNIYEEIDQGPRGGGRCENGAVGEADGSPIYEVIKDGEILYEQDNVPSDSADPQFYYALYNFGGSDGTQLSLVAGQVVLVLHAVSSDWWFVEDRSGKQGYAPASYLTRYT